MGVYNYKITEYAHGTKISHYARGIQTGHSRKGKSKTHENGERTEQQEKHSIQVSLNRTKNKIFDLAKSNKWEFFITLTFDPKKYDSTDYDIVTGLLKKFVDNVRKNYAPDLIYLIVLELHSDGKKFHFHGLLANIGNMYIEPSGKLDNDGNDIYNLLNWKYGFSTASFIKDSVRASAYITKYITKECVQRTKYKRRYYTSRNIKKPDIMYANSNMMLENVISLYSPDYIKSLEMPHAFNRVTHMEIDD